MIEAFNGTFEPDFHGPQTIIDLQCHGFTIEFGSLGWTLLCNGNFVFYNIDLEQVYIAFSRHLEFGK